MSTPEERAREIIERFGRGFSRHNLARFRDFYLAFPSEKIRATVSLKSHEEAGGEKRATVSRKSSDGLLQATTREKSATVLRISGARGGAIDVARMVYVFLCLTLDTGSNATHGLTTYLHQSLLSNGY